jgi:hypothetical protein
MPSASFAFFKIFSPRLPSGFAVLVGAGLVAVPVGFDVFSQQMKALGPGQRNCFRAFCCGQSCIQRQSPLRASYWQLGLVQHLMSSGVPGHALEMYVPPSRVHEAVGTQTPTTPSLPVQRPLTVERGKAVLAWTVAAARKKGRENWRSMVKDVRSTYGQ